MSEVKDEPKEGARSAGHGHRSSPGFLARFLQKLFSGLTPQPVGPKRQEYIKRGPTKRMRRGKKGNAGARVKRVARRRRLNEIARESRRRNRR